ncbi:MAG: helix-turn-helix domain-containing protein [Tannerella sp.]|jgi:AraC-like DNA-binding protein|nr:helix-turn-helix domain-containing protein [Tannerella sp.]
MKTINIESDLQTILPIDNIETIDNYQDLISIVRFQHSFSNSSSHINAVNTEDKKLMPADLIEVSTFIMILVEKGNAEISLDYKTYHITSDKMAFIIPNHLFRIYNMSSDFIAKVLTIDRSFFEEVMQEINSSFNYISFKRNPVVKLELNENADLQKVFLLLQEKIRSHTHFFYKELIRNITETLLLEFLNVLAKKKNDFIHTMFSRQEDLVDKFFKLLAKHAKEQHLLSFYADKLFITPKYLTVILKKLTGKTGSKWISDTLVFEAKKLIKSPSSNIQEVAYALNFNDQSAFRRFFKKSMGISPIIYRRSEYLG